MEYNIISINKLYIEKYLDLLFNDFDRENLNTIQNGIKRTLLLNYKWYGDENTKNLISEFFLDESGFTIEKVKKLGWKNNLFDKM